MICECCYKRSNDHLQGAILCVKWAESHLYSPNLPSCSNSIFLLKKYENRTIMNKSIMPRDKKMSLVRSRRGNCHGSGSRGLLCIVFCNLNCFTIHSFNKDGEGRVCKCGKGLLSRDRKCSY